MEAEVVTIALCAFGLGVGITLALTGVAGFIYRKGRDRGRAEAQHLCYLEYVAKLHNRTERQDVS